MSTVGVPVRLSRLSAPLAAAAVLLGLAGCGSGGGEPAAADSASATLAAMERVADHSRNTDSASYSFELSGTGGLAIGAKGTGAYRTKPALAMQMVFDEIRVAGQAIPGGMEQRIVGDTMYLKTGLLGTLLGAKGGGWMKVPLNAAGGAAGLDGMLSQSSQVDPRGQLQLLLASDNVHKVGEEKVDGVATTHYAAELTAEEIADAVKIDDETRDQLRKVYSAAGDRAVGMDVWVDSEDRARRFVTTTPSPAGDLRMTIDFTDYGKTLDIAAPEGATDFAVPGLTDSMTHDAEAPKAS